MADARTSAIPRPVGVAGGGEILARLNRAVQRTAIYPEGHPAIQAAVDHFLEAFRSREGEEGALVVSVTRNGLSIEGEPALERAAAFAWLGHQLDAKGISSLTLTPGLAGEELLRFALWLGRGQIEHEPDGEPEARFEGLSWARVDYGRARFREKAADSPEDDAHVVRSWASTVSSLTDGWLTETGAALPRDPEALGREVSAFIARNEGVGSGALASRVFLAGAEIGKLPAGLQAAVRSRLAGFLVGLTPDLQSEILRVAPDSDPAKLTFVTEILEGLPDTMVMDILADLGTSGDHVPHQFVTFMQKLVSLAARDPLLAEATEGHLEWLGLPRGLTSRAPEEVRAALDEVLRTKVDDTLPNPKPYQRRLEQLSARDLSRAAALTGGRHGDPCSVEGISLHVAEIGLRLALGAPQAPDAPLHLKRVLAEIPRAFAAGRFDLLHAAATALRDLRAGGASEEVRRLAGECAAAVARPEGVQALLSAVEGREAPPTAPMVGLFRAMGHDAARLAFERLAAMGAEEAAERGRERLRDLLVWLDPEALSAAIGQVRDGGPELLSAVFGVLRHPAAPKGADLALTFLGNRDPGVRLQAMDTLFGSDLRPATRERCIEKALLDPDPRVVARGIAEAAQRKDAAAVRRLGQYLRGERRGAATPALEVQAVEALEGAEPTAARDVLAASLGRRRWSLRRAERRVCHRIVAALEGIGDEPSLAAISAWRRSPAARLGRLLRDGARS